MIDKTIVNGKIIEPEMCGALGPYEVECQLAKGHEGQHEAGLNSELYEWENEDGE